MKGKASCKPIANKSFSFEALNGSANSTKHNNTETHNNHILISDKENNIISSCEFSNNKRVVNKRKLQKRVIQPTNISSCNILKKHRSHSYRTLRDKLDNYGIYPDVYVRGGSNDFNEEILASEHTINAKQKLSETSSTKIDMNMMQSNNLNNDENTNKKLNYRRLWRKVMLYVITMIRMRAKPPEGYIRTDLTDLFRFTIQAMFQKVLKQLIIYVKARDKWRPKDLMIKNKIFHTWFIWAKAKADFRSSTLFLLRRWRNVVRNRYKKLYLFRLCFWPFRTWRKHSKLQILQRVKTTMLTRIWAQYLQIKSFRAWNIFTTKQVENRETSISAWKQKLLFKIQYQVLYNWKSHVNKCRFVSHIWNQTGSKIRNHKSIQLITKTFTVWKYYSFCCCQMKNILDFTPKNSLDLSKLTLNDEAREIMMKIESNLDKDLEDDNLI